jgi:hypothetical protein
VRAIVRLPARGPGFHKRRTGKERGMNEQGTVKGLQARNVVRV